MKKAEKWPIKKGQNFPVEFEYLVGDLAWQQTMLKTGLIWATGISRGTFPIEGSGKRQAKLRILEVPSGVYAVEKFLNKRNLVPARNEDLLALYVQHNQIIHQLRNAVIVLYNPILTGPKVFPFACYPVLNCLGEKPILELHRVDVAFFPPNWGAATKITVLGAKA